VVGCGCYCIVGNNFTHNSQETILMPIIIGFVVKIVKQKHEVNNIRLLFLDVAISFIFIELLNSSLGDDFTPSFIHETIKFDFSIWFPTTIVSIIMTIFRLVIIAFHLFLKFQFMVSCQCAMVLP
jgi:hypothetical protein